MRKIVAGLFISLDGVVESPEKWHFPYYDEDMGRSVDTLMRRCEAMLLGRNTYETFASHWPHQDPGDPLAAMMNGRAKYVVSSTLTDPAWQNTTVIAAGDVAALKEGPGGDLGMSGSPTLVVSLLREGLLDELHLLVHPVVVGSGQRLFEEGAGHIPLKLTKSETFGTGVLDLTYGRA
ncbi:MULTISPECIES: dihydrofolate reductase family protein [Nonomuraea]|uniref:Dihydrofolate reductase family protein n=2 Tax=Nonomuraea TaxID=83681 RepID=A0ABW1C115_9ACTN|nr:MULTISPECIES: dihydrofolate reductase family protein [Nonomuraea]MDA0643231.1 dihydrofolate reductase family protein [Nonomuraea ferruginea]